MRKQLLITAFCAGCFALGAQAQVHSGTTSDSTSQDSSKPSTWDRVKDLAATGRNPTHEVRASQLSNSDVKSSTGESIGTISDVIINPSSGKVDFAVLSLSGGSGSTSSSSPITGSAGTSSKTYGTAGSSASATGGKLVAVPFSLLHLASMAQGTTTGTSGATQPTFTFTGDVNKLQTAPAFDPSTDITKPGWLQSIFSYFGVSSGSATGGATSPGSSSTGGNRSYPQGNPSNNP